MIRSTNQLLRELAELGVELYLEGERIRVRAPIGTLTPGLGKELQAHRDALQPILERKAYGPGRLAPLSPRPQKAPHPFLNREWGNLARDGVRMNYVVGTHLGILMQPNAAGLAAQLLSELRGAQMKNCAYKVNTRPRSY